MANSKTMAAREKAARLNKINKMLNFDYTLLFIVIFILAFGFVMLYSTSAYAATIKTANSSYYLKKQAMAAGIGFVGMAIITKIDYRFWKKFVIPIYLIVFFLCVAVIFVGTTLNESSRWLMIGGISVQPSEFAKVAVILFVSYVISISPRSQRDFKTTIKTLGFVFPIFAVVAYNNLSTAIIILGIACVMVFIASPRIKEFFVLLLLCVAAVIFYISIAGYRAGRIDAWLHPGDYISGTGFQTLQGLYAIGSGGLFGKGLGESLQKFIVPEAQNDMIFTIICEELGIFGAICVILMYILLLYRLIYIANHAKDLFGSYICIGIMTHIALQVILNIAVVTNSIPNTGVTLPFISYGGTSVMVLLCEIGLALSVSKKMEIEQPDE